MTGRIPGFTSTGSKRPDALFGEDEAPDLPSRMVRASGCRITDAAGREYTDFVMALGAVALGYAHPAVTAAVSEAAAGGVVGPLAPVLEEELAEQLARLMPWVEQVRFLKTGAEAVAAALRIARTHTGRELVLGCGYHGWLDGTQSATMPGVPASVAGNFGTVAFNEVDETTRRIRRAGDALAAVIVEPVIEAAPAREWLQALRDETRRVGALLVFDEIKTAGRVALNGAAGRWGGDPDLVVLGKAIANGLPLAAVGGRRDVMAAASRTWISSTLATEFVSLAAARATLEALEQHEVPAHLERVGALLLDGLAGLASDFPARVKRAAGIPSMCFLEFHDDADGAALARAAARAGVLFKRSAYNFVSLAHDERTVADALAVLRRALMERS